MLQPIDWELTTQHRFPQSFWLLTVGRLSQIVLAVWLLTVGRLSQIVLAVWLLTVGRLSQSFWLFGC
jgi:hypothetical protein